MQVELRNIRKYFGAVKANDGINIIFEPGKIYGLLGENGAGKSTLMKTLSGFQLPTSGEILLNNQPTTFPNPATALANGVGMLYQDPLDFPPFRIIDNYLLGRGGNFALPYRKARKELIDLATRYGFELDPDAFIDTLSLGERQQLELTRLLAGGAEFLILDEPTTGISAEQKDILFKSIRTLAYDEGKTIVLVSHKLPEVQDLCDHAFVLRKGKQVGEMSLPCPNEKLVELMFGQVPEQSPRPLHPLGETRLFVNDVSVITNRLSVDNLNIHVAKGEILGLAGLEGNGQRLLMQACAGLLKPARGNVAIDGENINHMSYHQRQRDGISYVAAGRLEEGLVAGLTLTEHVVLTAEKRPFFIDWNEAEKITKEKIKEYQVVGTHDATADALSGGNQQRLMFSLLHAPLKLLLLEHPTRGLDVRSAEWLWHQLYSRRKDGTTILFMSADLDEIIERSDRIAVFSGGKMSRFIAANDTNVEELGYLIGGGAE